MKKTLTPFLSFLTPQRVQVAYMIPVKRVSVLAWRIREPGPKPHLPAWTLTQLRLFEPLSGVTH